MSKKKLENQNAPVFAEMNAKKHLGFINSHQVEDANPEDLCFCGEPISELGCGKIVCGEKKAEQAQFLPMCVFQTKVATDSRAKLPPRPFESCHRFR